MQTVSAEYIMGIKEARSEFEKYGADDIPGRIENTKSTLKGFSGTSPVGQMLKGELDFWKNQLKRRIYVNRT